MPVSGPDLGFARKQAEEAAEEAFATMVRRYNLWDISKDNTPPKGFPFRKKRIENWAKLKTAFFKAVEELFVEDACNSWRRVDVLAETGMVAVPARDETRHGMAGMGEILVSREESSRRHDVAPSERQ